MAEKYSFQIAESIQQFLEDDNWHFQFMEDEGMFRFNLQMNGRLRKIEYVLQVRENDYIVYAICPLNVDKDDPDVMQGVNEFLARVNYGTVNGNFEIDYSDGEVRYKTYVNCEDIILSTKVIRDSIYIPATSFKQYGDGLVQMMFTDESAERVYAGCRKKFWKQVLEQYIHPEDNDNDDETE